METTPRVLMDITKYDKAFFTNSLSNDALFRPTTSNQRLLLGTLQNSVAPILITSNAVGINVPSTPLETLDVNGSITVSKPTGYIGINAYLSNNKWVSINSNVIGSIISNSSNETNFISINKDGTIKNVLNIEEGSNASLLSGVNIASSNKDVYTSFNLTSNDTLNITHRKGGSNVSGNILLDAGVIGINTETPQANLDVTGSAIITGSTSITGSAIITNSNGPILTLQSSNAQGVSFKSTPDGSTLFNSLNSSKSIYIQSDGASTYTSGLVISSNNYVGINNSNPSYILDIGAGSSDTASIRINTGPGDKLILGTNSTAPRIWQSNNQLTLITSNGVISFNNSNSTENVRIDSSGYLGVGVSNPSYPLDVKGNINFSGLLMNNGTQYVSGTPGFCNGTNTIWTKCNVGINTSNPTFNLDVGGNINFTGTLTQNGKVFLDGGLSSNFNYVRRFQVLPVCKSFLIQTSSQTLFELTTDGNVEATPDNLFVTINGSKLAYIDSNNSDFILTTSNNTPYTTTFYVDLSSPSYFNDVVDITIFPYLPNADGVFVSYSNLSVLDSSSSSQYQTKAIIGTSNISSSNQLYVYNQGDSNWVATFQNGSTYVNLASSAGTGLMVTGNSLFGGNLTPTFSNLYDLGAPMSRFNNAYLTSIDLNTCLQGGGVSCAIIDTYQVIYYINSR